jgi:hypothetical protein
MIAPTRYLVAELNRRARNHRLNGAPASSDVRLADGNRASVGDVIITRSNDRRLRLTATDWVKNGDRWTITRVGRRSELTVRHNRSNLTTRLPADYVQASTCLGYATTIHAAQGVTADTTHGLATGLESRQQLYTMLTRGRAANHLYLQVVGDGDPHSIIRPDTVAPRTPTELLRQILARDDAPTSATTLLRQLSDPAARLYAAVQRYTDSLQVAAEHLVGSQIVQMLDGRADQVVPELTSEPSWPTLRAHLLALAAETDEHPLLHLQTAAAGRDLQTAGDMAAVLDWRLPEYRQRFMIITFGASIWRSGRSSLSASQIRFETAPARTANSRYGHRRAATRPPPSSVKSPSGVPPSASTPKTADQPEQDTYKRRPPFGNRTSTEPLPYAAAAQAQM